MSGVCSKSAIPSCATRKLSTAAGTPSVAVRAAAARACTDQGRSIDSKAQPISARRTAAATPRCRRHTANAPLSIGAAPSENPFPYANKEIVLRRRYLSSVGGYRNRQRDSNPSQVATARSHDRALGCGAQNPGLFACRIALVSPVARAAVHACSMNSRYAANESDMGATIHRDVDFNAGRQRSCYAG